MLDDQLRTAWHESDLNPKVRIFVQKACREHLPARPPIHNQRSQTRLRVAMYKTPDANMARTSVVGSGTGTGANAR